MDEGYGGRETWEERVERKLDFLCTLLTGNGDPQKGLVVRVDRLEQAEKRRKWWVGTAVGAAIVAVVNAVMMWLGFRM